jgi:hypothetical protein
MMPRVRTTVSLDDDLASKLKARARERDAPFKQVLNEAIRAGLAKGPPAPSPYRVKARPMGVRPGVNLDKALQLAAEMEDQELLRKLQQGR